MTPKTPPCDDFVPPTTDKTDVELGLPIGTKLPLKHDDPLNVPSKKKRKTIIQKLLKLGLKLFLVFSFLLLFSAMIWISFGWMFLVQLALVAFVAYLVAGGGYQFLILILRTAPRDLTALQRYLRFLWKARRVADKDLTVADIFREHAVRSPSKVVFMFENTEWTALEVESYSNRVANFFLAQGLKKGDSVALMLENRPEFVCLWLGLSKLGVITALINHNLRQNSLLHCINIADIKTFIYGVEVTEAVQEIAPQLGSNVKLFSWNPNESSTDSPVPRSLAIVPLLNESSPSPPSLNYNVGVQDKLIYIYTSGTTGLPKAAVISNHRYYFLAGAIAYQIGFQNKDRFYTPLPLYHTAGGAMSIGQALIFGCCVVIRKKFSASNYFSDVCKYKCTVGQYIGEMCRYLLSTPEKPDDKAHQVRLMFGNGLRPQIWSEFVERFRIEQIGEFYGATEGNANIANIDNQPGAIGFVSRIIPTIYPISIIRVDPVTSEPIRNSKGLCQRCEPGEPGVFIGKIVPSNPARAYLGYVNEKDSAKKIVTDVFEKGDSAFLSGDLLVMDKWGYLYFKDRTGDTFRWKGENVSTCEVEGVVSNVSQYRDCVVYGVEVPGYEGRAGMAAILDINNSLDVAEVSEGIKKALPSYARPMFIRCLREVEMTGTYKLKKLDLQKEGFDPSAIQDKLSYMSPKGVYEDLTSELYKEILAGKIRL
uniref:long-chain-fatty-acid--CoA ligase n=2 Tax=Cacopsylla melanoneura TaxID=428564 RepID=A0A8D8QZL4_9HEMI